MSYEFFQQSIFLLECSLILFDFEKTFFTRRSLFDIRFQNLPIGFSGKFCEFDVKQSPHKNIYKFEANNQF